MIMMWAHFLEDGIIYIILYRRLLVVYSGRYKGVRVLIGLKIIRRSISLKIHPSRITPITLNESELSSGTAIKISNFIFTYLFVFSRELCCFR